MGVAHLRSRLSPPPSSWHGISSREGLEIAASPPSADLQCSESLSDCTDGVALTTDSQKQGGDSRGEATTFKGGKDTDASSSSRSSVLNMGLRICTIIISSTSGTMAGTI